MSTIISLAAWERWELANFDGAACSAATRARTTAKHEPSALVPVPACPEQEMGRLREAARLEGYQAGFASGREAAEAEGCQLAAHLAQAISRFETGIDELEHAVADELLALALEIARKVIQQATAVQPEAILDVIREALAQLPLQHTTIHLNVQDAALVRNHAGAELTHGGHRIQEDPQLARGDVVVEAGGTHLDARLATRWQRVIAALDQDAPWLAADEAGQS